MKKFSILLIGSFLLVFIAGCATVDSAVAEAPVEEEDAVPLWISSVPVDPENDILYGVGSANLGKENMSLKKAMLIAGNSVIRKANAIVDEYITANSEFHIEAKIKEPDMVETYEAEDGTVYVLMSLDKNEIEYMKSVVEVKDEAGETVKTVSVEIKK